jgi:hypothetical protein
MIFLIIVSNILLFFHFHDILRYIIKPLIIKGFAFFLAENACFSSSIYDIENTMKAFWIKHVNWLRPLLVAALMIVFVLAYWQIDGQRRMELFIIENSPLNTREFLDVFEQHSLEACKEKNTNKYDLPEKDCVKLIRKRTNICKSKAAEKFLERANTVEKMLLIRNFYTTCIFEEDPP